MPAGVDTAVVWDGACQRSRFLRYNRAMSRFIDTVNEQIGHEFAASQQYLGIAVWYDAETLPQLASRFYRQAVEERNHAMMLVQFLLDAGQTPVIPGCAAPRVAFSSHVEPVEIALAQEQRVTAQFTNLLKLAREEGHALGEQFLGWFLKEQLEEESSMTTLLRTLQRAGPQVLLVEAILGHVGGDEGADASAPHAAGGAL
jgi:bacterioferritin B